MSRDDAYILDMLIAARHAVEGLGGSTFETLETDWKVQAVVLHEIQILGEAAKRLSSEFRHRYPQIPWGEIAGIRDIIVHHYDRIDFPKIWSTIHDDLPGLIDFLKSIVPREEDERRA